MTSKRLLVGSKYAFAFGFEWHAVTQHATARARRDAAIAKRQAWEASVTIGRAEYLGVSADDFAPIPRVKTLAAAAQAALHPKLIGSTVLIVIEEQNQGRENDVAVIGLVAGNIVVDDFVPFSQFAALRQFFDDKCVKAGKTRTIIGRTYTSAKVQSPFTWDDLMPQERKGIAFIGGPKLVEVKPLRHPVPLKYFAAVAIAVIALSGIWIWKSAQAKKLAAAQKAKMHRAPSANELYAASVQRLLQSDTLPLQTAFAELREHQVSMPTEVKNWQLEQVRCEATGSCVATWGTEDETATIRDFVDAVPKAWGVVSYDFKEHKASHALPFKLSIKPLPEKDIWPTERDFTINGLSHWGQYRILDFKPDFDQSVKVQGAPDGTNEATFANHPGAVTAHTWSVKDMPFDLSDVFMKSGDPQVDRLFSSAVVSSITLRINHKEKTVLLTAGGLIYVRP